jgi:hypothetical protein
MGMSGAERQARYMARLKARIQAAAASGDAVKPLKARIRDLESECAALKAELAEERHAKLAQAQAFRAESQRRAAKPKAEKAPLPPDEQREREIKALRTRIRNLLAEHRHMQALWLSRGLMPERTRRLLAKCLHPDTRDNASKAHKDEASALFFAWTDASKTKAGRR